MKVLKRGGKIEDTEAPKVVKLNLGCGMNHFEGYTNVDKCPEAKPDVVHDLEIFPWPWASGSVDEIVLIHVLEHLGGSIDIYRQIWQEIYRVSKPDAKVVIICPHPTCDDFINDPTHVRAVTPVQLGLFDQDFNRECAEKKAPNTPLGQYWGINFKVQSLEYMASPWYKERNPAKQTDMTWLNLKATELRNQITQFSIELKVVK